MLKIVFMGSSPFGQPALEFLAQNHHIIGVYTRPPLPAGRGLKLQKTPIHIYAEQQNFPVYTPKNFKDPQEVAFLKSLQPDMIIVAAYGVILPQVVLDIPVYECLNIHGSILPRWRGAAPIHRAIMAGDEQIGVTIMRMSAGLDEGDMIAVAAQDLQDTMTTGIVHDILAKQGAVLLIDCLKQPDLIAQKAIPQPETGITYAHKILKHECEISWDKSVQDILRFIRALNPFPSAFCYHKDIRYKIHAARQADIHEQHDEFVFACQDGLIKVTALQAENKKIQILE